MTDTASTSEQPEAPAPDPNAVQVTINGVAHTARKGQLVIEAAADAGEYIPRFCYHNRMAPVGKCRMCLVEADSGRGPAVTVSCMVQVAPDMKINTESPTVKRMQDLAKQTGMVLIVPMYEEDATASGIYYNTAAVIDADGKYLGKYRKTHIPHVKGFWEKFYFRPGNMGYPVFETAVGKVGVYICYDRHFPEGWRALGLNGAEIVFNPSATSRGLSEYLWRLEQPASAVANIYYVGAINRVGIEPLGENDFYGQSYFVDPEGKFVGDVGDAFKPELIVRDLDMGLIRTVRDRWAFYRDRRPDAYDELVAR